ncbi:MAG: GH3 auxin-responsive promoter family protein [Paenibacillus macerans]|uniref:GH3 auxin-responsive promoter family protein n=1 Tax=Paenibacillus macerans TaxID=44252 RepID=A0A090ZN59_PAEMA|nr:GH3 auxin-responsive promoter family protein [Paenibacillus macerans]KFN12037.1 GH3 auxin-responsive promoter family protein [Paenibacillus macerans]MBS5912399.1 GH3 auxin-responsive promoter family protein [Paenibacillus macerans]MCY7559065.1 GH3 auxin-responsive promoter family protein [Paenibacillus macerans]MDU5946008.1 GH3 auxin-responsive promoter family protein [Paenibacillus macerans]MDU7472090.1 GH3 auxin-responsive promoter family protein [Paenibacillus macerans]
MITKQRLTGQLYEDFNAFRESLADIEITQQNLLMSIIRKNESTEVGRRYGFAQMREADQYRRAVPVRSYNEYAPDLEEAQRKPGVLTRDPIFYWAKTSGSSGTAKLIPHTRESLDQWSRAAKRNLIGYMESGGGLLLPPDGKVLSTAGPRKVGEINGVPVGYISGIMSSYNSRLRDINPVPDSVMELEDYDRRMFETAKYALKHNIVGIGGITSFSLNLLNYIKYRSGSLFSRLPEYRETVRAAMGDDGSIDLLKLWPNFRVMLSTGVLYDTFIPQIRQVLGDGVWVSDFYSGTEGAYGCVYSEQDPGLTLNADLYYFEFRDPESGSVCPLADVRQDVPYEMIITGSNGLYRYTTGDVVRFVSADPPQIKVVGRTVSMVNLTGEKLNEAEIAQAVNQAAAGLKLKAGPHLFFGWMDRDCFVHHCLGIEMKEVLSPETMNEFMDAFAAALKEIRIAYRNYSRTIIKPPHYVQFRPGTFAELERQRSEQTGITGHIKVKAVVTPQFFREHIDKSWIIHQNMPQDWEQTMQ